VRKTAEVAGTLRRFFRVVKKVRSYYTRKKDQAQSLINVRGDSFTGLRRGLLLSLRPGENDPRDACQPYANGSKNQVEACLIASKTEWIKKTPQ